MAGKGFKRRPSNISREEYDKRYDDINWGKKLPKEPKVPKKEGNK